MHILILFLSIVETHQLCLRKQKFLPKHISAAYDPTDQVKNLCRKSINYKGPHIPDTKKPDLLYYNKYFRSQHLKNATI